MAERFAASGVTLEGGRGPLPAGGGYDLLVDAAGLSLSGGTPVAAWQIPHQAMAGTTLERRGRELVLGTWVSGSHLRLLLDPVRLEGGSPEELEGLLAGFEGRTPRRVSGRRRTGWLVAGLGAVLLAVALILVLVFSSGDPAPSATTISGAARTETQTRNLVVVDLPSGWSEDATSTAPLAGLMGITTSHSSTPSAEDKAATKAVVARYESCMGTTDSTDRVFGTAGVKPALQLPSAPFGQIGNGVFLEVGTTTQRYASEDQVRADLVQLRSKKFAPCFAAALGRLAAGHGMDTAVTTSGQSLPSALGVYTTGANVTFSLDDGAGGGTPVELGVTLLVQGPYEETLLTFSSPGAFPSALRTQLVSTLAARLGGASGPSGA